MLFDLLTFPTWFEAILVEKVIKHSSASSMKSNQIKFGKGRINRTEPRSKSRHAIICLEAVTCFPLRLLNGNALQSLGDSEAGPLKC